MAKKTSFYEQPIDRTPYTACAWVGLVALVIFLLAAFGIMKIIAALPKHFNLPSAPTLHANVPANDVQSEIQGEIDKQKQAAASAAVDAAKNAADQAIQQQVDQQKNQLQNYLGH